MATLPNDIEKARFVLSVFEFFGTRPEEVLFMQSLLSRATAMGWRMEDVSEGLTHGEAKGWFEAGPNGSVRLTHAGFTEI